MNVLDALVKHDKESICNSENNVFSGFTTMRLSSSLRQKEFAV